MKNNLEEFETPTPAKLNKKVKQQGKEICKIKRKLFCPNKMKQRFSITEECAPCE